MTSLSQDSYLSPNNCLFLLQTPIPSPDVLNGSLEINDNLQVDNDALINGDLNVQGNATVQGITALQNELTVAGGTVLDSILTVEGESTFSSVINANDSVIVTKDLTVNGDTTLEATTINTTLNVTEAVELADTLFVEGNAKLTSANVINDFGVGGNSTFTGDIIAGHNIACPVYSNEIPQPASGENAYILGFGLLIPNPVDPETYPPTCVILYSGASAEDYYFVSRNGGGIVADVWGVLTAGGRVPGVGFTVQSSAVDEVTGVTFNYLILKGNVVESSSFAARSSAPLSKAKEEELAKAAEALEKINNAVSLGYTEVEARTAVLHEAWLKEALGVKSNDFLTSKGFLATESYRYALSLVRKVAPVIPV